MSLVVNIDSYQVDESGWLVHLRHDKRTCRSLALTRRTWSAYESLRYDNLTDRAWREGAFIARPLSSCWRKFCVPAFAMSSRRIIYAACRELHSYAFTPPRSNGLAPGLRFEGKLVVQDPMSKGASNGRISRNNITGLGFNPDESALVASFEDGSVMEIQVPESLLSRETLSDGETSPEPLPAELLYKAKHTIACLSARSHLFLTFSSRGDVTLYNSLTGTKSNLALGFQRSAAFAAYLSASGNRYAALGTSGSESVGLRIHTISESDLCQIPSVALGFGELDVADDGAYTELRHPMNAALALSDPPPHFGSSGQVLVAGWMDGVVRIYDLRSSRRSSPSEISGIDGKSTAVPTLLPVMSMYDRVSRGIGTVASGGGAGCYVAASALMDSSTSFWDVRSPRDAWSVHAPVTTDPSPVYTLGMESSRLFGATGRRPFIYDFGPGLTPDTYPTIEMNGGDGLALESDGIGYRVRRY